MGDLIRKEDAKWAVFCNRGDVAAQNDAIDALPPVDAVPVVHGRWETVEDWNGDEHYKCSVCGAEFVLIDGDPDDNDYLYCPHCGADMRKDGDHHED